jgi:hypothetical protein
MTSPGAILDLLRFKKIPLATLAMKVFECNYCEYVLYYDSNELHSYLHLHPGPQNRSQTIARTPHHLMAAPTTTINDVLGILNAVN